MIRQVMFCVFLALLFAQSIAQIHNRPHIIFILADDMGWNDAGFTGRSDLQTPNIDALAYNGRILTQHYALPSCTPSRSALLTGKYPIRIGMQGYPLSPTEPRGMPLDQKMFPQYMKDLGYQTHIVGKWHMGYHEWRYTPTARKAFDSHFGYMNGFIGYYDHLMQVRGQSGHDFWYNSEPMYNLTGQYVTHLLTDHAIRLINDAAPNKNANPLFLYLAHLAPHAGNPGKDLEYPEGDLARFNYIPNEKRRKYAAMVWNLDKSVGAIVQALSDNNMLGNSIIVFASDNGAQTIGMYANDGSNYPLQGLKFSIQDGGVRTLAAVWSPLLHGGGRGVSHQLFHMSDWLPTLYYAAGGNLRDISGMDGRNQWPALLTPMTGQVETDEYTTRSELLINIDETFGQESLIYRKYKLLKGTYLNGSYDGPHGDNYLNKDYFYNPNDIIGSPVTAALRSIFPTVVNETNIMEQRNKATIHCYTSANPPPAKECKLKEDFCLYDIRADPCERINLAGDSSYKAILDILKAKLETFQHQRKNQLNVPNDNVGADPTKFNNTWVCWRSGMPNSLFPEFTSSVSPSSGTTPRTSTTVTTTPITTTRPGVTIITPKPTGASAATPTNMRLLTGIAALLCIGISRILT